MKRIILSTALALASVLTLGAGPSAAAPTWTEMPSGTTSEITAIEYQAADRMWFTTSSGEIFRRVGGSFVRELGPTAVPFNDIEFRPGTNLGFAVGNAGQVYRSADGGDTWIDVNPGGSPIPVTRWDCKANEPLGNVNAVRFAGPDRVWIMAQGSQLARSEASTLGGTGQWVNVNRDTKGTGDASDDTCRVPTTYGISDAFFVPSNPNVGYFCTGYFGEVFLTTNNLGGTAAKQAGSCGNGTIPNRVLAGDPGNPNRMWSAGPGGTSVTYWRVTEDAWARDLHPEVANSSKRAFATPYDLAFNGGTVLLAGDAGMILNSIDGRNFYYVDAAGSLGTQDWKAVALASASSAAVGGVGGKLAVSDNVNTIPDIVKPTGSIGGPSSGQAGQALTFTAQVADEAGGSGVDPGSLSWTVEGLPGQTGQTATFTFPNAGFYTVRLTFRDHGGNTNTATKSVSISQPPAPPVPPVPPSVFVLPPASKPPITGGGARRKGRNVVLKVKGKFAIPSGLTAAQACRGQVIMRVIKGKKLLTARTVKLSSTCSYRKTIKIARKKVGKAKRLTLVVTFIGNDRVRSATQKYKVKVRR